MWNGVSDTWLNIQLLPGEAQVVVKINHIVHCSEVLFTVNMMILLIAQWLMEECWCSAQEVG